MKTQLFLAVFSALLAASCISCSDIDREKNREVTEREDITLTKSHSEMVATSNAFSFNFFTAVNKAEVNNGNACGNIMISPLSMQSLLSMMTPGASSDLASEIIKGLGFDGCSVEELASFYSELIPALLKADSSTTIWNANAVWVRKPLEADTKYISIVQDKYGATASELPLNGKEAADLINKWCSDNTNKMIDHIFDSVPDEYKMILANALYFKGIWSEDYEFDEALTKNEAFTCADGSQSKCKIMHKTFAGNAYCDKQIASVALPFGNEAFTMRFILPVDDDADINSTLASLTSEKWEAVRGQSKYSEHYGQIILSLPRFESEYLAGNAILKEAFEGIGLGGIFTGIFDSMANKPLVLGEIGQKTKIKVNETGAEAAAVSWGANKCTSVGPVSGVFHFEATRPFIYVISESSTGAILFAGVAKKM